MATGGSCSVQGSKKRKQVVLSIDEMFDKYGFGMVNSGISVIRTFCLSEPLELAKGVWIIEVGLYYNTFVVCTHLY